MVLVYAADGETQDKLQSVRNALDVLRLSLQVFGKDDLTQWVSLLFKRTKLDRLLVQFAYDVNYFFPGNIEMLVLNGLTLEKNAQQLVDVAEIFRLSEVVNALVRSIIAAIVTYPHESRV